MAITERQIVITSKDANGNSTIDMPVTKAAYVEGAVSEDTEQTITGKKTFKTADINALTCGGTIDLYASNQTLINARQIRWMVGTTQAGYINGAQYSGNAATATKAKQDSDGNAINTTYIKTVNNTAPDKNGNVSVSAGMPIGHEYFTTNPNIPAGSLPLFGGEYSREAYADLWAWIQQQTGFLITEAEWQEKATANAGNVPFYSDGDGSTTFRVQSLSCWVKGANSIEEVGSYLEAGLPNIKGTFGMRRVGTSATSENYNTVTGTSGAISYTLAGGSTVHVGLMGIGIANWSTDIVTLDASRSSSVYGNSDTVQPKSIAGMWLVKAFGTVSNVGNQDIADISAGLTSAETRISSAETRLTAAEVDIDAKVSSPFTACATTIGGASTTKPAVVVSSYRSGTEWYRKYSDGWIEQGGYVEGSGYNTVTINLHVAMKTTDYCAISQAVGGGKVTSGYGDASNLTTTTFSSQQHGSHRWYVCGV